MRGNDKPDNRYVCGFSERKTMYRVVVIIGKSKLARHVYFMFDKNFRSKYII